MNQLLEKLERKIGRYAVPHLTMALIACWVIGYALQAVGGSIGITNYMSLNIDAILHGQVWRLITWIIIPPSSLDIWTIIMLLFYVSIGTTLERVWGDFRYNVYLFGGMLLFIIAGFITYGVFGLIFGNWSYVGSAIGVFFSTYYIAFSMLLAYAATFPDAVVYLMFLIPVKMKYLGWLYVILLGFDAIHYAQSARTNPLMAIAIIAMLVSLLNFGLFYLSTKPQRVRLTREQKRMREMFRENVKRQEQRSVTNPGDRVMQTPIARHRCEVCGRTDVSNPELEFRYCTKCEGAHEYCMDHLYTHEHRHE